MLRFCHVGLFLPFTHFSPERLRRMGVFPIISGVVAQIRILTDWRSCSLFTFPGQPNNVPYLRHWVTRCIPLPIPMSFHLELSSALLLPPWHRPSWTGLEVLWVVPVGFVSSFLTIRLRNPAVSVVLWGPPPDPDVSLTPGEVRGWRAGWSASWGTRARLQCRLLQLSPRAPCPLAVLGQSRRCGDQPSGDLRVPAPAQ